MGHANLTRGSDRWPWVLLAVAGLAVALAARGVVLAGSPEPLLIARALAASPPLDPEAPVWASLPPLDVPLSGQQITIPRGGGSLRSLRVKAAHDGKSLFLHLEGRDRTRDERALAAEQFTDAVAGQFPEGAATFA